MEKLIIVFSIFFYAGILNSQWVVHSIPTDKWLNDIKSAGNSLYVTGNSGTILKSTNGGLNWTAQNSNTSYDVQTLLFIDDNTGFAIASISTYYSAILKTTNGGANWNIKFSKNRCLVSKGLFFLNANTGYAGSWGFSDTVMFRTTDAGENWSAVRINYLSGVDRIQFINTMTGWAVGGMNNTSNVLKTTDGGYNWYRVYTLSGNQFNFLFAVQFVNQNTGWAVGLKPQSVIIKTTDGGNTWSNQYHNHTTNWELYDINMINENTGWIVGDGGVIVKTTNGGINWRAQVNPYSGNPIFAVRFSGPDTGYAVCSSGRVLKTVNGGGPVGIPGTLTEMVPTFMLYQNFPNPFNPVTKIRYAMPRSTYVKLTVIDALGREVETLTDKTLNPGTYETPFDASHYPSGIYYYRLTADGYSETRKMVVIK